MANPSQDSKHPAHAGFTFIELMVAISIVALLSSVILASLHGSLVKARDAQRLGDLHELRSALEIYWSEHGSYPALDQGSNPQVGSFPSWSLLSASLTPKDISVLPSPPGTPDPTSDPSFNGFAYFYDGNSGTVSGDGGSRCLVDGYVIYTQLETNSSIEQNDGGIFPNLYEIWGGTYHDGGC